MTQPFVWESDNGFTSPFIWESDSSFIRIEIWDQPRAKRWLYRAELYCGHTDDPYDRKKFETLEEAKQWAFSEMYTVLLSNLEQIEKAAT